MSISIILKFLLFFHIGIHLYQIKHGKIGRRECQSYQSCPGLSVVAFLVSRRFSKTRKSGVNSTFLWPNKSVIYCCSWLNKKKRKKKKTIKTWPKVIQQCTKLLSSYQVFGCNGTVVGSCGRLGRGLLYPQLNFEVRLVGTPIILVTPGSYLIQIFIIFSSGQPVHFLSDSLRTHIARKSTRLPWFTP